ncbi:MAG: double zinc ribbon domain-containing protein [Chlamydiota bacterium]
MIACATRLGESIKDIPKQRQIATALARALISLIYPAFCLHCAQKLAYPHRLICKSCASTIEWIDKKALCPYCGSPSLRSGQSCPTCRRQKTFLQPHASLFVPFGPIADLWMFFRHQRDDSLAKLWACLITIKLAELPWPLPSVIVPVPASRVDTWRLRNQESALIAKALGRLFDLPVVWALARTAADQLVVKKSSQTLCDQKVLLVTAELLSSDFLAHARRCLRALFPAAIYSLAVIDRRAE